MSHRVLRIERPQSLQNRTKVFFSTAGEQFKKHLIDSLIHSLIWFGFTSRVCVGMHELIVLLLRREGLIFSSRQNKYIFLFVHYKLWKQMP